MSGERAAERRRAVRRDGGEVGVRVDADVQVDRLALDGRLVRKRERVGEAHEVAGRLALARAHAELAQTPRRRAGGTDKVPVVGDEGQVRAVRAFREEAHRVAVAQVWAPLLFELRRSVRENASASSA